MDWEKFLPLLTCLVLAASLLPSLSPAYAMSPEQTPTVIDTDQEESGDGSAHQGMFPATAALGKALVSGLWSMFGIYVPGFSFTFGQMWLGAALASISILVVRLIFGFGGGSGGVGPRTSSASRPKISKERRHDEF